MLRLEMSALLLLLVPLPVSVEHHTHCCKYRGELLRGYKMSGVLTNSIILIPRMHPKVIEILRNSIPLAKYFPISTLHMLIVKLVPSINFTNNHTFSPL